MKWIKIEDFVLEQDSIILVTAYGQTIVGYVHNNKVLSEYMGFKIDGVTHCQNLPDPAIK